MAAPNPFLEAALAYARRGWPIFPCSPEKKQPLTSKESKPGAKDGGLYLATTDETQIRAWWVKWPKAMIGLPTGRTSGTVVIDLDPKKFPADTMFVALEHWLGQALTCAQSRTQSGGLHLIFAAPAEQLGNRAHMFRKVPDVPAEIHEHVDVRADGVYPTFKIVISANRKPTIKGNDDGIWRRVTLVPFDVQIAADKIDKGLIDKLWAERSGVLNWIIEGVCNYLEIGGLDPPDEVKAATLDYREESDVVGAFIRAGVIVTGNAQDSVETGKLYTAFVIFCKRSGVTPFASSTFNRRLPKAATKFGFSKGKSSISLYAGITIHPDFEHHATGGNTHEPGGENLGG